jgi:ATP synthase protein I
MGSLKSDKGGDKSRTQFAHLMASYRDVSPYLGLGLQLAVSILVFLFLGRWVDGKLGTTPVFMIIGAFVGAAGGMISFIRVAMRLNEENKRKKKEHET